MKGKVAIEVRQGDGTVVETIQRVPRREQIGNFCPAFCQYRGKRRCLIESDALHFDDPMRFSAEEHTDKLFIRPRGEDGRVVATWEEIGCEG